MLIFVVLSEMFQQLLDWLSWQLSIPALPKMDYSTEHAERETTAWRKGLMSCSRTFGLCRFVFKNHHLTLYATFLPAVFSELIQSCSLTELQPVPRELPFVGVIREPFALLIHGHVLWVQDHGQVARLQIATIRLKQCERDREREHVCELKGHHFVLSLPFHFNYISQWLRCPSSEKGPNLCRGSTWLMGAESGLVVPGHKGQQPPRARPVTSNQSLAPTVCVCVLEL